MRTKKQILYKKAWKIFSQYIRQRDKGICFTCGDKRSWKEQNAGHFIPQSSYSDTMFSEMNVNCQCVHCNKWLHGNLGVYSFNLIKKHGIKKVDDLMKRKDIVKRWTIEELEKLINHYSQELNKYENNKKN